jgi:hypothetical protein
MDCKFYKEGNGLTASALHPRHKFRGFPRGNDKQISIKCEGSSYLELEQMNKLQGNLKAIDKNHLDDLKQSLIKHGIPFPFSIWKDKKDKFWIIDGTHRFLALSALKADGFFIPPLPVITIIAANKKEASQFVLISNSTYAHMTSESLSDFMIDFELSLPDLEFLDLPDLDMRIFNLEQDEFNPDDSGDSGDTPKPEKRCPHCNEVL